MFHEIPLVWRSLQGGLVMLLRLLSAVILAALPDILLAAPSATRSRSELPPCGRFYAGPFGSQADVRNRKCGEAAPRNYTPKHRGIGFEVLDLESEACFVPDEMYRLLDHIVDVVVQKFG